jgi:hypothetical protein
MGDFKRRVQDALIPGDPESEDWLGQFHLTKYGQFLFKRADLLLSRIREVAGESLLVSEPTPDELAEQDDQ